MSRPFVGNSRTSMPSQTLGEALAATRRIHSRRIREALIGRLAVRSRAWSARRAASRYPKGPSSARRAGMPWAARAPTSGASSRVLFADLVGFTTLAEGLRSRAGEEPRRRVLRAARGRRRWPSAAGSTRSSATPSSPCSARRWPTRTTPSGPCGRRCACSGTLRAYADSLGIERPDARRREHRRGAGRAAPRRRRLHGDGRRGEHRRSGCRWRRRRAGSWSVRPRTPPRGRGDPLRERRAGATPGAARSRSRLAGPRGDRCRRARPRQLRAPFDRPRHRAPLLVDGIRLAVNHCRPSWRQLEGEGGVGKSRLAEELLAEATVSFGAVVLSGRCMPYGESNLWHPIARALRQYVGLDPGRADQRGAGEGSRRSSAPSLARPESPEVAARHRGLLHLFGEPTAARRHRSANARERGRPVGAGLPASASPTKAR